MRNHWNIPKLLTLLRIGLIPVFVRLGRVGHVR